MFQKDITLIKSNIVKNLEIVLSDLDLGERILKCVICTPDGYICKLHSLLLEKDLTEFVIGELERLKNQAKLT